MHGPKDDLTVRVCWGRVSISTTWSMVAVVLTFVFRAIPNGVVSAFSTVIIRDMVCHDSTVPVDS